MIHGRVQYGFGPYFAVALKMARLQLRDLDGTKEWLDVRLNAFFDHVSGGFFLGL
jgi:hypothetical protein